MEHGIVQKRRGSSRREILDRIADEYRLESLRQAVRRELRTHGGQRTLAKQLGLSRSVVRKLVEMRSVPTAENLQVLQDWAADRPEVDTPLGSLCFAVLAADLPPALRYQARLRLADALADVYAGSEEPAPAWLSQELGDRRGT